MSEETCYETSVVCQVVDNYLLSHNQGLRVYENILNPDGLEYSSYSSQSLTSKFSRTFSKNDPHRMIAAGRPPSDAGWEDIIDGHTFRDNPCSVTGGESDLNIEPINFYDYRLSASQTEYALSDPSGRRLSVSEKRSINIGEMWCRNTLSTKIDRLETLLPGLKTQPLVYNNVVDMDVIYDSVILYTPTAVYMERFSYDYDTGEHLPGGAAPILLEADDIELSKLIRIYFNERKNLLYFGKTVQYDVKTVVPEIYSYNVANGFYSDAYSDAEAAKDLKKYRLPPDLERDFDIQSISTPILVYNDKIQKFTVIYSAFLATTYTGLLTGEFEGDVYCVFIHNYKALASGLKYIDSIIYHPENKREYREDDSPPIPEVFLEAGDPEVYLGDVLASDTVLKINPIHIPLREAKLKEIIYLYDGKIVTQSRLPVNDMRLAKLDNIKDLVDSYTPHASGGSIDFASPRYQPVEFPVNANIPDISIVQVTVSAVYFDGYIDEWRVAGEIRPRPLTYMFKDMSIIDAVSYTTPNATSMLKLILETQSPKHIVEYVIDNSGSADETILDKFDLLTPTVTSMGLSGSALSGTSLSGIGLSG